MIERRILEYRDDSVLSITIDGFFNYEEFAEVIRILKEVIGVSCPYFITGWESMVGETTKDEIELKWKFNNWDCIQLQYINPKDDASVEKVRKWAKIIFENLISKFGEFEE